MFIGMRWSKMNVGGLGGMEKEEREKENEKIKNVRIV